MPARMSALADQERTRRQQWAAAGSGHDRFIKIARTLLPFLVVGMLVALTAAPLTSGRDISFVLSKDRVAIAPERLRVTRASYSGRDQKGEPFVIRAGSAVQKSSTDTVVKLTDLSAHIALQQGPADVVANSGRYDMANDKVFVDGPVRVTGPHKGVILTRDVAIDISNKTADSTTPVDGSTDLGTFKANHMHADLNTDVVQLDNAVRLHIDRRPAK